MTNEKKLWTVKLHQSNCDYDEVKLVRKMNILPHMVVIEVDINKLLYFYENSVGYKVSAVSEWPLDQKEKITNYLNPKNSPRGMPFISFAKEEFTDSYKEPLKYMASFNCCRHRTIFMASQGAKSIPIEVNESEAELVRIHCGI